MLLRYSRYRSSKSNSQLDTRPPKLPKVLRLTIALRGRPMDTPHSCNISPTNVPPHNNNDIPFNLPSACCLSPRAIRRRSVIGEAAVDISRL